jgi:uncharacterized protein with ParB-like and HNH nuclease domain
MTPDKKSISDLFDKREQYLIPLFQRGYVWTLEKQIALLWEDIVEQMEALAEHRLNAKTVSADKLRKLRKHFLGAIVLGPLVEGDGQKISSREVIDGQQRITTLQILLLALRDVCKPLTNEALDDDLRNLTFNKGSYLNKADAQKVMPTNAGRDVMQSLVALGSLEAVCERYPAWRTLVDTDKKWEWCDRPLMVQAYLYFHAMLLCQLRGLRFDVPATSDESDAGRTISEAVIRQVRKANEFKLPQPDAPLDTDMARLLLDSFESCFQIMQLRLEDEDDPQIIFETLNARGEPLTPSDLIRNFVFLRAIRAGEDVDALYDEYWKQFDEKADPSAQAKGTPFWRKEERQGRLKSARIDLFMYHYTTLRRVSTLKVAHVFEEFKDWWDSEDRQTAVELGRIKSLSTQFEKLLAPGQKGKFDRFCRRLLLLDTSTATPLLLHFLEHHKPDSAAFEQVMLDIDSYLVRRFVCGLTTKSYNKTFMTLLEGMVSHGKACPDHLRSMLHDLQGESQLWPDDQLFSDKWQFNRLYQGSGTRKVRAVLEGLEMGLRSYKQEFLPELDLLSVEHIMPQKWKAEDYPLAADDAETRTQRSNLIHSIGNLTLVTPGYNSSLSNGAFSEKRPEISANSGLQLNSYFQNFADEDKWDESAIRERALALLPTALSVWPKTLAA